MKLGKASEDNIPNFPAFPKIPLLRPHFRQGNHPLHLSGAQMDKSKRKWMKADEMDENI